MATPTEKCSGRTEIKDVKNASRSAKGNGWATRLGKVGADVAVNPVTYLVAIALTVGLTQLLGDTDYVIFILAAFPVVGLTLLSKSPVGREVQQQLEESLAELETEAAAMQRGWDEAKGRSPLFGPARPLVPSFLQGRALDGSMPGDYAFDPLGLWEASSKERRAWMAEAELLHARWAMLGVVGALVPELISLVGVDLGEPVWWKVGAAKLQSDLTLNYAGIEGFRIAGSRGIWLIIACQIALMGGPEYARYVGIDSLQPVGVFLPGTQIYPGGVPFDPASYSKRADAFVDQQVKEIKHGRLAMVAFLGLAVQAAVTREGPLRNLLDVTGFSTELMLPGLEVFHRHQTKRAKFVQLVGRTLPT